MLLVKTYSGIRKGNRTTIVREEERQARLDACDPKYKERLSSARVKDFKGYPIVSLPLYPHVRSVGMQIKW